MTCWALLLFVHAAGGVSDVTRDRESDGGFALVVRFGSH